MKNKKLNKNSILVITGIIVLVLILLIIIIIPFTKNKNNATDKNNAINSDPMNNQPVETKNVDGKKDLEEALEKIAGYYYENDYYTSQDNVKLILPKLAVSGINITLSVLNVHYAFDKEVVDALKKYNCNLETSKIFIYPESPYDATNYSTKARLQCD